MPQIALALMSLLLTVSVHAQAETLGPFSPNPCVAVYLAVDGEPCEIAVFVKQASVSPGDRFLVRLFDAGENLSFWRYTEFAEEDLCREFAGVEGVDLVPIAGAQAAGTLRFQGTFTLAPGGVHQLRVSTGFQPVGVTVETSRPIPWGVCFQNGDTRPWKDQPERLSIYVPDHAEELQISGGRGRLMSDDGLLADLIPGEPAVKVPVTRAREVWTLELDDPQRWSLRAAGFPVILCPSPEAARRIQASVITLPDGTVVCHRFQQRIQEILPTLLDEEHVGRTEDLIQPLSSRLDAWLADPLRNVFLVDGYLATIDKWLRTQNLDPTSHWSGSMDGWQEKAAAEYPENRWDRLRAVPGLYAGASNHYGAAGEHLAHAALYDDPTNPWFGRRELLTRAAAAALRDLTALAENEVWPGVADMDPYPGMMAFAMGQKTLPVYGVAAPHVPEDIRALWTEGVRRIVDRSFCDNLVSCRNQSSHYLVAFQSFADGSGLPEYETLARLYCRRWNAGMNDPGYHMERCGPDASYIGMTHWHEAVYYRMSGDPAILDSLRASYRFFNHTVGPEPDGRILGGFNFNHRVGEGFYGEQWGGAKGIIDDVLPEVGVWAGPEPSAGEHERRRHEAADRIRAFMEDPKHPLYADITTWRYWGFTHSPERSGGFPCQEEQPFIRVFSDELVAVKRPAYYLSCYVGKPASEYYISDREEFRLPFPNDAESSGGELPDMRKVTPFLGGGLTGLWTEGFGHSIMTAAWAPTTHHGIIATLPGGRRMWEDYHAHTHDLDETSGTLTIRGKIEGVPVDYIRTYTFADDHLGVDLTLSANEPVQFEAVVENIPVCRGEWKSRGSDLSAAGVSKGEVTAPEFRLTDTTGNGVRFDFGEPVDLNLVPEGLKAGGWRKLQFGRAEVSLPQSLQPGQPVRLAYQVWPVTPME